MNRNFGVGVKLIGYDNQQDDQNAHRNAVTSSLEGLLVDTLTYRQL